MPVAGLTCRKPTASGSTRNCTGRSVLTPAVASAKASVVVYVSTASVVAAVVRATVTVVLPPGCKTPLTPLRLTHSAVVSRPADQESGSPPILVSV